jgi:hypothetical protein
LKYQRRAKVNIDQGNKSPALLGIDNRDKALLNVDIYGGYGKTEIQKHRTHGIEQAR